MLACLNCQGTVTGFRQLMTDAPSMSRPMGLLSKNSFEDGSVLFLTASTYNGWVWNSLAVTSGTGADICDIRMTLKGFFNVMSGPLPPSRHPLPGLSGGREF